ncbi:MFS transporter [Streptomyces diastatochromogenes]|nr:MFS transporter [Streptomyces diastatochromogenes]
MTTTPVSSASDQHDSPEASRATRAGRLLPADPVLRLATVLTVVNSLGNGLYFPLGILYFTRIVGLDATAVGVGMTVAGLVGVAAGVPAGRAADRWGARRVGALMWGGTGIATAAYTLVHSYTGFLVTVICATAFQMASRGVQGALYADVLPAATRVEARAYLRMVTNVGMGVGGALGAVALQLDTRGAYLAVIVLNALSFAGPALLVPRMPLASHVRERAALDADAPPSTAGGRCVTCRSWR